METNMRKRATDYNGLVACPAHAICARLGTIRAYCRYDVKSLPPSGVNMYTPEDSWCSPGVVAILLLLSENSTSMTG